MYPIVQSHNLTGVNYRYIVKSWCRSDINLLHCSFSTPYMKHVGCSVAEVCSTSRSTCFNQEDSEYECTETSPKVGLMSLQTKQIKKYYSSTAVGLIQDVIMGEDIYDILTRSLLRLGRG